MGNQTFKHRRHGQQGHDFDNLFHQQSAGIGGQAICLGTPQRDGHPFSRDGIGQEKGTLERWEARATEQVISAVAKSKGDAHEKLRFLLRRVGELDTQLYEAINHLGGQHPELAGVLRRVHDKRVHFVEGLLASQGFDATEARVRAQVVYAWAMGELLTREPSRRAFSNPQIDAIERLLMARPGQQP